MNKQEFVSSAESLANDFGKAFVENSKKVLISGALDEQTELNFGTLKALLLITAEQYHDSKHSASQQTYRNLSRGL